MSAAGRALGAVAAGLVLAACTFGGPPEPRASRSPAPTVLNVMEFNIEYGGEQVDFASVPKAIEAAGADVVAIEEGYGNMQRIADALGWPYVDDRTQIVSRYPLLEPPGGGPFAYVEVAPGRVVAVANVHLPSTSYGPFKVRDGASAEQVVSIEQHKRVPAIQPALSALFPLPSAGIPVFLAGDFNAPSHLDWTPATVGTREQIRFPVDWPVSEEVEGAGLVDSYRAAHPDPVADPGLTWPADRPFVAGYNPYRHGAPADRIDFIYAGGPARVTASRIVGEPGGEGVDIPVSPWPTDHRATVSTFEITPGPEPAIVSVDARLSTVGQDVTVRDHGPDGSSVAIVAAGDPATEALERIPVGTGRVATLSTANWRQGSYEAVLVGASGDELARAGFWLERPGGHPVLGTDRRSYAPGQPVRVSWKFAPGDRFDWVAVYRRGADPNVASYLLWAYTGATVDGAVVLDDAAGGTWPLRPGRYSVYLLEDDSYRVLASVDLTVG